MSIGGIDTGRVRVKRKRMSASWWVKFFKDFALSGQNIRDFCRSKKVSPTAFYRWRKRLDIQDNDLIVPDKTSPLFTEVSLPISASSSVELKRGDIIISMQGAIDGKLLKDAVSALGAL